MQVLEARGKPRHRGRRIALIVIAAVVLIGVVGGLGYHLTHKAGGQKDAAGKVTSTTVAAKDVKPIALVSSTPAAGAVNVASNATITLQFTAPVSLHSTLPTLAPAVAGTWTQPSRSTLAYQLAAPMLPSSTEVVTIPGGTAGVRGTAGGALVAPTTVSFSVADGSDVWLEQLLAELNYLPLSFVPTGPTPAAADMAETQPGSFAWRWTTLPARSHLVVDSGRAKRDHQSRGDDL